MNASAFDADVIVIGSGPAGVSVAFPLVEAGLRVLMIDGAGPEGKINRPQSKPWQKILGPDLEALLPEDGLTPKLRGPVSRRIVGKFQRAGHVRGEGFVATGAYARGGLSQLWGGFACEFGPEDLATWPFPIDDLRPSYKTVTERIGISGSTTDDLAEFYGSSGLLLPSLPLGPTAAQVFRRYKPGQHAPEFALGAARNAILTIDRGNRKACNLGLDCLWGCERGAVYDARFDLEALQRHSCFHLRDDALAIKLSSCRGGWEVSTADGRKLRAPRTALAAGTLSTIALALPLLSNVPSELRLLNSPALAMPLLLPGRLGRARPRQGFSLAQLGYRLSSSSGGSDYVTGGVYELASLPPSSFVTRLPLSYPAGIVLFTMMAPALLVATGYFHSDYSNNRLRWERRGDRCVVVVRGGVNTSLAEKTTDVTRRLTRIWRKLGAWTLPGTALAAPGTDVHIGGPFAMGLDLPHGTSINGELHAAPGVFIVDGAAFPSMPPKYPTLTIMANADRIGRHLAAPS
jgi:choline dehydrogenase-like flavoprotein